MFLSIIGLLSGLISPLTSYLKNKQEAAAATHTLEMARLESATELAKVQSINDSALLTAQLNSTSSGFKDVTFILIMSPVIITVIFPSWGHKIFESLATIPEYYQYLVLSICSAIWGIKNVVQPMRSNAIIKKVIDKREFFDDLRKFKGPISQAEVDLLDRVLDDNDKKG